MPPIYWRAMPDQPRGHSASYGMGVGWAITSTLIAGIVVLGALGYLIDRVVGTQAVFRSVGVVAGGGFGIYIVYLRYGRGQE